MPSASSTADLHVANNLRLAAGDLRDAKTLRKSGSRNAAYHAEQAAEKLLLALLVSEGKHPSRSQTHQLDTLTDMLDPDNPLLERLRQISFLTAYATAYRYPREGGRLPHAPDWSKIDAAISTLSELIDEACKHFGVDVDAAESVPARNVAPMKASDDGAGGGASGGPKLR